MDNTSLTLILTALTAGAVAGIKDTADEAVKDTYHKLKTLLQKKFADRPTAILALAEHEKKPAVWKAPLEEELKETEANKDQEIISLAQELMTLVQPQQVTIGKFTIQNTGNVQGQIIGEQNQITLHLGEKPKAQE